MTNVAVDIVAVIVCCLSQPAAKCCTMKALSAVVCGDKSSHFAAKSMYVWGCVRLVHLPSICKPVNPSDLGYITCKLLTVSCSTAIGALVC